MVLRFYCPFHNALVILVYVCILIHGTSMSILSLSKYHSVHFILRPRHMTHGLGNTVGESSQLTPLSTLCKQPGPINRIPLLLS